MSASRCWPTRWRTAAILFVLITALGPISGAHFNPAVTLVLVLRARAARRRRRAHTRSCKSPAASPARCSRTPCSSCRCCKSPPHVRAGRRNGSRKPSRPSRWWRAFCLCAARSQCGRRRRRADDCRRLLVDGLHLVRQPGHHHRARAERHVCRHPPAGRAGFHRRANRRRAAGDSALMAGFFAPPRGRTKQ